TMRTESGSDTIRRYTARYRGTAAQVIARLLLLVGATAASDGLACTLGPDDVLITDVGRQAVIQIESGTGATCVVSAGGHLVLPTGIAIDASGQLLVVDADAFGGAGGVVRIDPATGAQAVVASNGYFVDPQTLALGKGGTIYVADPNAFGGAGGIIAVNPGTGRQTVVSSGGGFVQPVGVAMAPK